MKTVYKMILIFMILNFIQIAAICQLKVGDKVQARTSSMDKWEKATIYLVHSDRNPVMYKATLDDPGTYSVIDLLLRADQIRSVDARPAANLALNTRVDVLYAEK